MTKSQFFILTNDLIMTSEQHGFLAAVTIFIMECIINKSIEI